ncbi:MAG TPA: zinc ribbon domain-containing protein [Candidatus Limnocylindrales bacterium]
MNIPDAIHGIWQSFLDFLEMFVIPDWGALIGLLPILLLLGVIGPLLTLVALAWFVYFVRKPRAPLADAPEPVAAAIGADGKPLFPSGEPFCYRDGLVYPPDARRCEVCGDELAVRCPKCGVGRSAAISTCGNCGLVLKVRPQVRVVRAAQPPPGGAAAA